MKLNLYIRYPVFFKVSVHPQGRLKKHVNFEKLMYHNKWEELEI